MTPLVERIEVAEGPSRELDREIALAVGAKHGPDYGWSNGDNGHYWTVNECAATFTGSLDAALSLVPEGWAFSVRTFTTASRALVILHPRDVNRASAQARAATPALAVCVASLRARTAEKSNG